MIFSNRKPLFANNYWRKMLIIMKLTTILLFAGLLQVHATAFSQKLFNLKASNMTVKDAFKQIEKESDYTIFFRQDQINLQQTVNIEAENAGIENVMKQILAQQGLTFELIDKMVVIKASQKNYTISGTITDEKGESLPGANVSIKGTTSGTLTNANGQFSLNISGDAPVTLVVSYLGFETQEISASALNININIVLKQNTSKLDEVVVIGYGTVKRRDLTGSVASVKAEDIALSPVSSPMEALQGRVAGLDIQRSSGSAGSKPEVLVRGQRSISGDSNPLYIIDGIPGDITTLNPTDIETIDVLKDASSTAIYGSSASNGIIMVTTKKAQAGKTQISVDSYYGVNGFSEYPKPLMGDAWIQYKKDQYFATNGIEANSLQDLNLSAAVIQAINDGKWVDWVDETLQNGSQQNHHVSIRGGSEKTQGFLSLGYIGEKGIYPGDEFKTLNARTGVDIQFNKIIKAGIQSNLNWKNRDQTNSRINKSFGIYPVGTPYSADGSINLHPIDPNESTISPLANFAPGVFLNNTKNLYIAANPYVEIKPIKNLSIRSNLGVTLYGNRNGTFQNENSYNLASEGRSAKEASYSTALGYNYTWENIINYNFTIQKDHDFTLTGITSWANNQNESSYIYGQGLDYDEFIYYNIGAASTISDKNSAYAQTKRLSFAGRFNYSYKGKYLLTASLRADGVSQLTRRWSSFPSVAGAWRISEESFMQNTKSWLNNLKLRASYGLTGNSNIKPYQTTTEVLSKPGTNLSLGGSTPLPIYILKQSLGNTALTWERSYNTNFGLDASVLNNRIDFSADYYLTNTKGVLYARKLPFSEGGFDAKTAYIKVSNIANTENKGLELAITSRNIVKKDFKWNTNLTFTTAKEKLKSIDLGDNVAAGDLISENLFIGQPINTLYGFKKIGVWQLGEETEAAKYGAKPGDIKIQTVPIFDENGVSDNGVHPYNTQTDRMILGHTNPDWSLGMQNSFTYKNLDLTVFVVMRYGQTIDADILGYYNTVTQPAFYDYWTPTNPTNDYPSPISGTGNNTIYQSALNIVDGSYFKIKNITLGYKLPSSLAKKIGFERCRVYGTAYNPFIFSKSHLLKEVDPETGGTDSFPLYKQIVFGINLSF